MSRVGSGVRKCGPNGDGGSGDPPTHRLNFAPATIRKALISPDDLDGTFFRWALAEDHRFEILYGALAGRQAQFRDKSD